jgi:hypothetical protein
MSISDERVNIICSFFYLAVYRVDMGIRIYSALLAWAYTLPGYMDDESAGK